MDKIQTPTDLLLNDSKIELAKAAKDARLKKGWKRDTLSKHTGLPLSTIKRYETNGRISLDHFLRLAFVLGDLDKLREVFKSEEHVYASLDEMQKAKPEVKRKRGRI